ncbi:hypothetical protein [Methylobacterium sp. J-068]|uniref:hypothetical protein n=1 Tax=Methylobacterium sp. J-068 TaxID=2836649 RepID=UPI001FB9E035|nr:hypothetical protein [Methylobacterium sp. J-068]
MHSFIPTSNPDAGPENVAARYYRGTAAAHRARLRRQNAGHQRLVRERRRDAGEPDPGLLDRCIVDALRSVLLRCEDSVSRPVDLRLVLSLTREHLLIRSIRAQKLDPSTPAYDGEVVMAAIRKRLFMKPKRPLHARSLA